MECRQREQSDGVKSNISDSDQDIWRRRDTSSQTDCERYCTETSLFIVWITILGNPYNIFTVKSNRIPCVASLVAMNSLTRFISLLKENQITMFEEFLWFRQENTQREIGCAAQVTNFLSTDDQHLDNHWNSGQSCASSPKLSYSCRNVPISQTDSQCEHIGFLYIWIVHVDSRPPKAGCWLANLQFLNRISWELIDITQHNHGSSNARP